MSWDLRVESSRAVESIGLIETRVRHLGPLREWRWRNLRHAVRRVWTYHSSRTDAFVLVIGVEHGLEFHGVHFGWLWVYQGGVGTCPSGVSVTQTVPKLGRVPAQKT